jgi:hypothetical protein
MYRLWLKRFATLTLVFSALSCAITPANGDLSIAGATACDYDLLGPGGGFEGTPDIYGNSCKTEIKINAPGLASDTIYYTALSTFTHQPDPSPKESTHPSRSLTDWSLQSRGPSMWPVLTGGILALFIVKKARSHSPKPGLLTRQNPGLLLSAEMPRGNKARSPTYCAPTQPCRPSTGANQ